MSDELVALARHSGLRVLSLAPNAVKKARRVMTDAECDMSPQIMTTVGFAFSVDPTGSAAASQFPTASKTASSRVVGAYARGNSRVVEGFAGGLTEAQ